MSDMPCAMAPAAVTTNAAPTINASLECFQPFFIELPPQAAHFALSISLGPK